MSKKPTKLRGGKRAGAGRPRQYDEPRQVVSGSVARSLAERLAAHSSSTAQTVSAVIEAAVSEYLDRRDA